MHLELSSRPSEPTEFRPCPLGSFADGEFEVEVGLATSSNFYAGLDDAGAAGVFVATYQRVERGTPVWVNVQLPGNAKLRVLAAVEWMRSPELLENDSRPGLGLQFEHLDPDERELVEAFAKIRAPMFYE